MKGGEKRTNFLCCITDFNNLIERKDDYKMSKNNAVKKIEVENVSNPVNNPIFETPSPEDIEMKKLSSMSYDEILKVLEQKKTGEISSLLLKIEELKQQKNAIDLQIAGIVEDIKKIDPSQLPTDFKTRKTGKRKTFCDTPELHKMFIDLCYEGKYSRKEIKEKLLEKFPSRVGKEKSFNWLFSYAVNAKYYTGKDATSPFKTANHFIVEKDNKMMKGKEITYRKAFKSSIFAGGKVETIPQQ